MRITRSDPSNLLMGFGGDVMIGRMVDLALESMPSDKLWGDLLPLLHATDLNIINLETTLTTSDKAVEKVFNFKARPERVRALLDADISAVNLANNHVLDFSEEGLLETLATLDKAHILHVGAGKNIEEARKPVILEAKGFRIGLLGYTDNEPGWRASHSPGVVTLPISERSLPEIEQDIRALRSQVDWLIISLHWGPNMQTHPSSAFISFAHALIDCGVDLIHGHSAHIFQGVEMYKNRYIFYDTGDFVDDYYVDPTLRNNRSFFFVLELTKTLQPSLQLFPLLIDQCSVSLSTGIERDETLKNMELLSKERGLLFHQEKGVLYFP